MDIGCEFASLKSQAILPVHLCPKSAQPIAPKK
jgi:hypothetical protein